MTDEPLDEADTRLRWQAVGAEIRAARLERGLSQTALAQELGIGQNVLSEDERGKERGIPIHRLAAYAGALHMDYDLLVAMAYRLQDRPEQGETFKRKFA